MSLKPDTCNNMSASLLPSKCLPLPLFQTLPHLEQRLQVLCLGHAVARQLPGSLQRQHWVKTHHFHAQGQGSVDDLATNGAQANDTQGLALNLRAHKHGLVLLNTLGNLLMVHLRVSKQQHMHGQMP